MKIVSLNKIETSELLGQFLSGLVYGLVAGITTTDSFTKAAIVAILVTGVKTGAHYALKALQPAQIREGKQYKSEHWTEKAEKML